MWRILVVEQIEIEIPLSEGKCSYEIKIGEGLLDELSSIISPDYFSKVAVLSDEHVAPFWGDKVLAALPHASLITVGAGEGAKSLAALQEIWRKLLEMGCDRHSLLINLGGGMVGDLGGFAAAAFMRGMSFFQIPTSLLAQVDASVGGKVGVNFSGVKNLLGSFQQPKGVLIDVATLATLPRRELCSGFAEIVKHALVFDAARYEELRRFAGPLLGADKYIELIKWNCQLKAEIVRRDEREHGVRKLLNFGHTVGHAVESISQCLDSTPLLHGEAVAIGMIVESRISQLSGAISLVELEDIRNVLASFELPVRVPQNCRVSEILERMRSDKKNVAGEIRWTLLEKLGRGVSDRVVEQRLVLEALAKEGANE